MSLVSTQEIDYQGVSYQDSRPRPEHYRRLAGPKHYGQLNARFGMLEYMSNKMQDNRQNIYHNMCQIECLNLFRQIE
jgi:hypothetical protein